jgi:hypothetical protein
VKQYLLNLWLWLSGWFKFGRIHFREGWSADWKWCLVYGINYGINVLTGGAVQSISGRLQRHRAGKVWDFMLDVIEKFDTNHGANAGAPLFGSVESPQWIQWTWLLIIVTSLGVRVYVLLS